MKAKGSADGFSFRCSEELGRTVRLVAASKGVTVTALIVGTLSKDLLPKLAELRDELNKRTEKP